MKKNPLVELQSFGQSIWLDFIRRGLLISDEFQSLVNNDGLSGMTSNPSIFEKAISGSHDYDDAVRVAAMAGNSSSEIYQQLTIKDVQKAADLFYPVFERKKGDDGFVSLEVSPRLAYDTAGTIAEAHRLWQAVDRPNVLIKIPATSQGLPAIRQLISDGVNVNVTLLFGINRYNEVIKAYISGLKDRLDAGKSVEGITSVASFFLSRIDVVVDPILEQLIHKGGKTAEKAAAIRGQSAIASAKIAYQIYKSAFQGESFKKLMANEAKPQRLLWASTSTKNAVDSDIKYVEALIGPDTINTLPFETLNAYRDHGNPALRLEDDVEGAKKNPEKLQEFGIDLQKVTEQLETQGVKKFCKSFDKLMSTIEIKRSEALTQSSEKIIVNLGSCADAVQKRIKALNHENVCQRLWRKDPSLWNSDANIKDSLGWLHIAEKMEEALDDDIMAFVQEIRSAGFRHVVHMGMGGSSLASLVFTRMFAVEDGLPLTILDTTDPETIKNIKDSVPIEKTLFIVASKSGTTAEPLAFRDYFFEQVRLVKGESAGDNFVAITDPDTPLARMAAEQKFRRVFLNAADIGGRYSALSYFGLVPAALMGIDIREILVRALRASHFSASCVSEQEPQALILGATLGELVLHGRDKATLLADKEVTSFSLWLEQLMAESTGKNGTGIIPIADEPICPVLTYGNDRIFVYLKLKDAAEKSLKKVEEDLQKAGQPVITIEMSDVYDIGAEMFRWEFATALAGSILRINPFDQPNVQESKDNTNQLLSTGVDPSQGEKPLFTREPLSFYSTIDTTSADDVVTEFLRSSDSGDYVALMAYLPEVPATYKLLQNIRRHLQMELHLPTTLGYGPRFLHSTGQLHKGGPNSGLFIQLTADDKLDIPIPGKPYTFGFFKMAQAQGDLKSLRKHGRRVMRVHLGDNVEKGLRDLAALMGVLGIDREGTRHTPRASDREHAGISL